MAKYPAISVVLYDVCLAKEQRENITNNGHVTVEMETECKLK